MKIEIEHILLLVIGAFILYHFMSRGCGCNNGFRVGAKGGPKIPFRKRLLNRATKNECNDRVAEVERVQNEMCDIKLEEEIERGEQHLGAAKRKAWDDMLREIQKCNARWEQKIKK